jgi:hypothetical protein
VLLEHGATVAIVERLLYNYRDHGGERLTLRPPEELRLTLGRILAKHGVKGAEHERLLAAKARWFGRPVHVAHAEIPAASESRARRASDDAPDPTPLRPAPSGPHR